MKAKTAKPVLTLDFLKKMKFEDVGQVYSGKDGRCCCGCAGIHRRSSVIGKRYPYDVINDKFVRKVLKILQDRIAEVTVGDNNFAVVIWERLYIVYPIARE